MDKSWVYIPRPLTAYRDGAWNFVNTALVKLRNPKKIRCPCKDCRNHIHLSSEDVVSHLVVSGMDPVYINDIWRFHGESRPDAATQNAKIQYFKSTKSSTQILSINDDALSYALGPERNGRVRAMGFGVTPSQLGVHTHQSKKIHELENQVSGLTTKIDHLTNLLMQTIGARGDGHENAMTPRVSTPQSQSGSTNANTNLYAGNEPKKCKLLNWQKKAVAKGTLSSIDPNAMVHHILLGEDNWKVWVDVALDPTAQLWKPTSEMLIIQDAVGTTVAWHKDFISFD